LKAIKYIFNAIQKFIWLVIRKVILPISLFLLYVFGIGSTRLIMMLFDRKRIRRNNEKDASFWLEAKDYDANIERCNRQS
jgi:hypothetical protein